MNKFDGYKQRSSTNDIEIMDLSLLSVLSQNLHTTSPLKFGLMVVHGYQLVI